MLGKILIFVVIAGAALVIFGRGAKRGEEKIRREAKSTEPLEKAKAKARAAKAQDLTPCPRCGAYVDDPDNCDCRGGAGQGRADMQQ
jgi:hypothetical protein